MKNNMNESWSASESTLRCTWLGISAKKKAAASPERFPNVSLPRKYVGTTVSAPQKAVDHMNVQRTASSSEENMPWMNVAGTTIAKLTNGGRGFLMPSG